MKLLVVCSSLDLTAPLSSTPAWWQLLKALYEIGTELVVTAYHGRVPATPWWQAYPNPARLEGQLYAAVRGAVHRLVGQRAPRGGRHADDENASDRAIRRLVRTVIAPRWQHHLARIIEAEPGIDAVLFTAVPANQLRGVATSVQQQFGRPVILYDGDLPASLPAHGGFATGFSIYEGADLGEFAAVLSNSRGATESLRQMGARAVHTLYYAADPQVYTPLTVPQDIDVFFYGHTAEYRADWLQTMVAVPSRALPDARFAVRGRRLGHLDRAETLPYLSFDRLRGYVARSKVNLVITREAHASVFASSTMRPFELAMMATCMVSSPYLGIEEWFEPEKELLVVRSAAEAIERYRFLISHETARRAVGEAARKRAMAEHTYQHRARQLVGILREYA